MSRFLSRPAQRAILIAIALTGISMLIFDVPPAGKSISLDTAGWVLLAVFASLDLRT